MEQSIKTYTNRERNYYLAGLTGQTIVYSVINLGLALYYTEALYVPPAVVAVLMLAARLWDGLNDFLMGMLVDRTKSRWGKCRPYLIFVPFILLLITVFCFSATVNYNNAPFITVVFIYVTYILWGMVFTIGDIPVWGITALMTENEKDRTKLISLARIFGQVGAAVITLIYIYMVGVFKETGNTFIFPTNGAYGYFMATLIFALIGCLLFQLVGIGVKERIQPVYKKIGFLDNFLLLGKNKPFIQVMISGILGSTRLMMASCSSYIILWYYANGEETATVFYITLIGGGYFIGTLSAMYFTPHLLKFFSKRNLYNWSNIISVIPFLIAFFLFMYNFDSLPLITFIIMIAGGLQAFPVVLTTAMIADSVDYLEWKTGEKADGLCFAGQTFLQKLQTAVAFYGALMVLSFVGYNAEVMQNFVAAGGIARQEFPEVMIGLFSIITILPALGSLLSVIPMWRYSLTEEKHEMIMAELKERRREREKIINDT